MPSRPPSPAGDTPGTSPSSVFFPSPPSTRVIVPSSREDTSRSPPGSGARPQGDFRPVATVRDHLHRALRGRRASVARAPTRRAVGSVGAWRRRPPPRLPPSSGGAAGRQQERGGGQHGRHGSTSHDRRPFDAAGSPVIHLVSRATSTDSVPDRSRSAADALLPAGPGPPPAAQMDVSPRPVPRPSAPPGPAALSPTTPGPPAGPLSPPGPRPSAAGPPPPRSPRPTAPAWSPAPGTTCRPAPAPRPGPPGPG